ncbi:GNAT family N-acetyltransferase [Streptomyces hydrogenans]|uniref:GNAT family N-acetyltransferase n=1 Tax=Streptomyces hydrogenans TaxID=1873719 RepID=UPI003446232B
MVTLRAARADEAETLTRLVMRSKAHWGYDAGFLDACAPQLRIRPGDVARRRVVVAEDERGGVLGVVSLEGTAPTATLGLLFVEPAVIGQGVGRLLYRSTLRRAVELGVRRLLIDADPHAAGFYRGMGAVARDAVSGDASTELVGFEVEPVPPADWAREWTGGGPAVHLGNVAEFNAQFAERATGGEGDAERHAAAHDYACLAAFYSPRPAALVLPRVVPRGWIERVGRPLEWEGVEVYDGLVEHGAGLLDAVRRRPALLSRLKDDGLPWVAWGSTSALGRVTGRRPAEGHLRYESKAAARELFTRILAGGGQPGIALPAQWRARGHGAAARRVAARARAGETTVVKTDHGVGGSGTVVVTPGQARASGGARAALRALPRGPLLVEEYVVGPAPDGGPRDLTYDGFVGTDGRVHDVGGAVMEVRDGAYAGATVGPSVVPEWAERPLAAFGAAVGRELAAAGYRGWFDVDFVTDRAGRLAPTETNLRLTGPSVAFMVAARLDELRGAGHFVRIVDRAELGARLPEARFDELCDDLARGCAELGAVFLPAIPTGAFAPAPWFGFLVAAHHLEVLDAAEALVRAAALSTGNAFDGFGYQAAGTAR